MRIKTNTRLTIAVTTIMLWLLIGTVAFHFLENWNWIQSFYFSVESMTTVGYGDFHPTTDMSRLFTAFYILFGAGIVVTSLGVIGSSYLENRETQMISAAVRRKRSQR